MLSQPADGISVYVVKASKKGEAKLHRMTCGSGVVHNRLF